MIRQFELVENVCSYDGNADEEMLNKAYVFSMKAHGTQKRASGDSYFTHPLEVAGILTDLKLDSNTIVTALLHDTVEDTVATLEEIEGKFGSEIAVLVDGVTKLSQLEMSSASDSSRQAENFRKLVLAMSNDIRVLLVKLADRLHNMRTLHFLKKEEKRRRISLETMEIYAPLAERIGMQNIKDELEDISFANLNPEARESVNARLSFLRERGSNIVDVITDELKETLKKGGLEADIYGREKRPYSIWRKMERKNVTFEQLSDIMAFRVMVDTVEECYQALGTVHGAYRMVPGCFKDYISTPKRNGYQSLHTSVIGPEKQRVEIQIRTREMHQIAEIGVAAHWLYKQQEGAPDTQNYRWLRELLEILDHASNPEEFLENTKLEMFQDQVFCFTPKGDLIAMPRGASPVDFAYAVHSNVGDTCVGARVNGRMTPLRTLLQNGDQVDILRSKVAAPSPTWENFVVTGKARSAIRRYVRKQERSQYADLGKAILEKEFRAGGHTYTDKAIEGVLKSLRQRTLEDVYAQVGQGEMTSRYVLEKVFPGLKVRRRAGDLLQLVRGRNKKAHKGGDHSVPIRGLIPGMAVHFASCCHPLPGDRIVGIVMTGKGVTVHTIDCETLEQFSDTPERWLDVAWEIDGKDPDTHVGRISVVMVNAAGSLSTMTAVIARNFGNISNLKITERSTDFFEMIVDIEVRDVKHLTNIIAALRADPSISSVDRARS
ncbi:MAG: bifunctional (p)ppGpp synthetase/guanosine-3',5'-bis(diphosphate) 3'-pyrophosphohydrolase [Alphaproteobacteria bacterium]|jgi:GTP diphosphokinase / guanosine-3',5'-bis(diphosphate) 3'-diphosphatase|nr:bifunctional (p)ppGpp synthetase/guanosine-3',5'-bis(diphosphate) 3'-pyrophosphohydrolase [Alphaproteobacteria bacterium]MBT4017879.1 bifunctional (p)ppGpp synthetase/guanosine-3',5'-bis(diphosphate) 3'-pyrophosphohydrolase [Alphaproteobacteria bacterium]MBT4965123.1 bifunctional (p)ppGpp synthetase/guanosine-3',5'-bis(diphosphate) 3'-pyrophosphohydrolase [Alphaproteobacteria bacterium]MBT5158851.1 bifunctional (p)ppGpp synthetase/guanosine-3',5'-bis(diphosphate) 3'-pyrophosphohydrolase [Alph